MHVSMYLILVAEFYESSRWYYLYKDMKESKKETSQYDRIEVPKESIKGATGDNADQSQ